jgi:hypothetical protein
MALWALPEGLAGGVFRAARDGEDTNQSQA